MGAQYSRGQFELPYESNQHNNLVLFVPKADAFEIHT
jgi:hypothetical protein